MKLSNIASTVIATLALVAGAAHAEDPVAAAKEIYMQLK